MSKYLDQLLVGVRYASKIMFLKRRTLLLLNYYDYSIAGNKNEMFRSGASFVMNNDFEIKKQVVTKSKTLILISFGKKINTFCCYTCFLKMHIC